MPHPNHERLSSILLTHLPLRPSTLSILHAAGFHATHDVLDAVDEGQCVRFARALRKKDDKENEETSIQHAEMIYREIVEAVTIVSEDAALSGNEETIVPSIAPDERMPLGRTAAEWLQHHIAGSGGHIITFCRALDELLAGGIAVGALTELAGGPGSGKTTLCLQLSVNAALPVRCGGVQGRVVYIDTEGSFAAERCHDLATHLIRHVQSGLRRRKQRGNDDAPLEWNVTAQDILSHILVYRVHDVAEWNAVLHGALPSLLATQKTTAEWPIRLLVVDSVAALYRAQDYVTRTKQLTATAATLTTLASRHQVAVVCVNHMTTTRSDEGASRGAIQPSKTTTQMIPALGASWAHAVTTRLVLSQPASPTDQHYPFRTCALTKSPRLPTGEAHFVIGAAGIRGVEVVLQAEASKRARFLRDA